jgi:hypothetical protein
MSRLVLILKAYSKKIQWLEMANQTSFRGRKTRAELFFLVSFFFSVFAGCTMPLPFNSNAGQNSLLPDNTNTLPNSALFQSLFIPLQDITAQLGVFNGNSLLYLNLNACGTDPRCTNELSLPLNLLATYQFFNSDNTPVVGQLPIFSLPGEGEKNSPYRQIFRVTVPVGYISNSIRSAEDLAASQFRIEASGKAFNFPLVSIAGLASVNLRVNQAWQKGKEINYLDLGSVPYSAINNQLGVGLIYFLRNRDSSDLPSKPPPILDSLPGDLLYSPIRQVFRAVSENQVVSQEGDISRGIRSQEALLRAVNQGLFRLEDTGSFFNYPVFQEASIPNNTNTEVYGLYVLSLKSLPSLPEGNHYALWSNNENQENRLLLRFRASGSALLELNNQDLVREQALFRFSKSELNELKRLFVTVEGKQESTPSPAIILSTDTGQEDLKRVLKWPFRDRYAQLQGGTMLLASPTDLEPNNGETGIWFTKRIKAINPQEQPLPNELEPGLVLALPPAGWVYQGWVLYRRNPDLWLPTGAFTAVNQADLTQVFSGSQKGFAFPGEDFLRNAPLDVIFPFNLPSSGEVEVIVALEPENILSQAPFLRLYRALIPKGAPLHNNLDLPSLTPAEPEMSLELRLEPVLNP